MLGLSAEDPFKEDEEECKSALTSWKQLILDHSNKIDSFWSPPAFKKDHGFEL